MPFWPRPAGAKTTSPLHLLPDRLWPQDEEEEEDDEPKVLDWMKAAGVQSLTFVEYSLPGLSQTGAVLSYSDMGKEDPTKKRMVFNPRMWLQSHILTRMTRMKQRAPL